MELNFFLKIPLFFKTKPNLNNFWLSVSRADVSTGFYLCVLCRPFIPTNWIMLHISARARLHGSATAADICQLSYCLFACALACAQLSWVQLTSLLLNSLCRRFPNGKLGQLFRPSSVCQNGLAWQIQLTVFQLLWIVLSRLGLASRKANLPQMLVQSFGCTCKKPPIFPWLSSK